MDYYCSILGIYRDNGKENGNHYLGFGVILILLIFVILFIMESRTIMLVFGILQAKLEP